MSTQRPGPVTPRSAKAPGAKTQDGCGVAILIPAAGASRRMGGRDKLLETVAGEPLLAHQVRKAMATGVPVLVTLPPDRPDRAGVISELGADWQVIADASKGLSASLRAGVARLAPLLDTGRGAIVVLLADMPDITTADIRRMIDLHEAGDGGMILRATTEDGLAGHPVLLPAWTFDALRQLSGDTGAGALLSRWHDRVVAVPLPGRRAITDLDTPDDWNTWRATHDRGPAEDQHG